MLTLKQALKDDIRSVCSALDERVLLPEFAPNLRISSTSESVEVPPPAHSNALPSLTRALQVDYRGSRFVFPRDDCALLPITNTRLKLYPVPFSRFSHDVYLTALQR